MAHGDLAAMRPAAADLAMAGRAIVIGWLSRGDGAPLELITTMGGHADLAARSRARPAGPGVISPAEGAVPLLNGGAVADVPPAVGIGRGKHAAPPRISVAPVPEPLLFPPGAWGLPGRPAALTTWTGWSGFRVSRSVALARGDRNQ